MIDHTPREPLTAAEAARREAVRSGILDGSISITESVELIPEWAHLAELAGLDPGNAVPKHQFGHEPWTNTVDRPELVSGNDADHDGHRHGLDAGLDDGRDDGFDDVAEAHP